MEDGKKGHDETMVTLIYGSSGSGKSEYAESLAVKADMLTIDRCEAEANMQTAQTGISQGKRYYVATMQVYDEESKRRVIRHRAMREGKKFVTIECEREIEQICRQGITRQDIVLLECLSNLVANEMFSTEEIPDTDRLVEKIAGGLEEVSKHCRHLIIVSNDIFSDGVSYDKSTEEYIKALGLLHQKIAVTAQHVTEVVYGIPIKIK